jgi:predicted GIY-YIG superfamily endonuclease
VGAHVSGNHKNYVKLKLKIKRRKLFKKLTSKSPHQRSSFDGIEQRFSEKTQRFENQCHLLRVEKFFGKSIGVITSCKLLVDNNVICENDLEPKTDKHGKLKYMDFKGLYVFYSKGKPFYVGISRSVINRIQQHVKTGKSHYSASMAYKIACIQHQMNGNEKVWRRDELSYKENIFPVQQVLRKKKVRLIPVRNDEELYLFEVYLSIKYDTILNQFTTH